MKLKTLVPILAVILTSSLFAGSVSWSSLANYTHTTAGGTDYFYTTASTQFVAEINGYGHIGGTARAFEGSGQVYAWVEGIWDAPSVAQSNSGSLAPAGRTVIIYRTIGVYDYPSVGVSKVTATW
ncbi:hypothetical protein VDG1235_2819 [Verrucomicrobiia bacterium DG1235]|nr:hypothetical protein VDG1235_2819 [Verrucomicrobiae bacterium DG1235]